MVRKVVANVQAYAGGTARHRHRRAVRAGAGLGDVSRLPASRDCQYWDTRERPFERLAFKRELPHLGRLSQSEVWPRSITLSESDVPRLRFRHPRRTSVRT